MMMQNLPENVTFTFLSLIFFFSVSNKILNNISIDFSKHLINLYYINTMLYFRSISLYVSII